MALVVQSLYPRWVLANGFAEAIGLGSTFVVGRMVAPTLAGLGRGGEAVATIGLAVLSGAVVEGAIVGLAQGWAVAKSLPGFPLVAWVRASIIGAALAWLLGMVPGVVAGGGPEAPSGAEPGLALIVVLASLMGAVAGPVLALVQWRVLRRLGRGAGRWIGANALAWMVGMPVIFVAMQSMPDPVGPLRFALTVGAACLVAGLAVGAIHGRFLVRILTPAPG